LNGAPKNECPLKHYSGLLADACCRQAFSGAAAVLSTCQVGYILLRGFEYTPPLKYV
jgi:hypothetical protein